MKDRIRKKAARLGFDRVGFTDLAEPEESKHLAEWLAKGMHGEMAYMERGPRAKPGESAPWARSMIVALRAYYRPVRSKAGCGRVARYALEPDYHDTLKARLRELAEWLERHFGARCKTCVDSSPVLERPFAQKAGLGWIGKNSLLLNRRLGSFFFIGEILTSLELAPDRPVSRGSCGRCTRCIEACPTRAIVAPYVVDARRCISYLTIEYRGVIERELRPLMGNMIFGCDICQDVCPWNRHAKRADPDGVRRDLLAPELAPLMSLSDAEFRRRFKGSALLRIKRDGFLRNVAIALGNSRSPDAVGPLTIGLNDGSWLVRLHSAWALGRIESDEAQRELKKRLSIELDPRVREEIKAAVAES